MTIPKFDSSMGVLFALLPGVLAYVIVHALSMRQRKLELVELTAYSLTLTVIIQFIWQILCLGSWVPTPPEIGLPITAIFVGLICGVLNDRGYLYRGLGGVGLTRELEWGSALETVFRTAYRRGLEYATIELKNGRRLLGYVRFYDSHGDDRFIGVENCQWILEDSGQQAVREAPGTLLFRLSDIEYLQFLPYTEESNDE